MKNDDKNIQENRERDLAFLKLLLAEIRQCQIDGKMPPSGAMMMALSFANKYPQDDAFIQILKAIEKAEQAAIKIAEDLIKQNNFNISKANEEDLKTFEDEVKKNPLKAAELYFATKEVSEALIVIDKIGKDEIITEEELSDIISVSSSQIHNRKLDIVGDGLGVKKEVIKQQVAIASNDKEKLALQSEQQKIDNKLKKTTKLKVASAVVSHHRENYKKEHNVQDVSHETLQTHKGSHIIADTKKVIEAIEHTPELLTKAATIAMHEFSSAINHIINAEDTSKLKELAERNEQLNQQKAKEEVLVDRNISGKNSEKESLANFKALKEARRNKLAKITIESATSSQSPGNLPLANNHSKDKSMGH